MRYSMKRAIAFVLSLTMALALPLTASAENSLITDIYEEDDSVGRVPGVSEDYVPTNSGSMSGSGTGSRTSPIEEEPGGSNKPAWTDETVEARILGVVLDSDEIEIEAGLDTPKTVQATIIFDGAQGLTTEQKTQLYNYLSWEFETEKKNDGTLDWTKAQVKFARKADGKCVITGLNGGRGYLNVWVDNAKTDAINRGNSKWDKDYEAGIRVPVVVKEYASNIIANKKAERTYYEGQKIDLNSLVDLYDQNYDPTKTDNIKIPNWNEQIGWTAENTKLAKIDAKGVATLKKPDGDKKTVFYGIGERGARVKLELIVKPKKDPTNKPVKKLSGDKTVLLNFGTDKPVTELDIQVTSDVKDTTDFVTWSVKKSDIVSITSDGDEFKDGVAKAHITANKVGKTTVTATASSGKKFNFSVKVDATLNRLTLEAPETVYVGQSVELKVTRDPVQNTDKLKWSVPSKDDKKCISVKNGIVTVNVKASNGGKYTVAVSGKKNAGATKTEINTKLVALKETTDLKKLANVKLTTPGGKLLTKAYKDELYTRQGRNYNEDLFTAAGKCKLELQESNVTDANIDAFDVISWVSNKNNVATVSSNGVVKAVGKGTAKLTVTGLVYNGTDKKGTPKYKISKSTVSLKVTQPVTRLQPKQSAVSLVQNKNGFKAVTVKVAKYLPKGTKGSVKWDSVDKNVATVSAKGKVEGKGTVGDNTSVIATEVNGATAKIAVGLRKATKSVRLDVIEAAGYTTTTGTIKKKAEVNMLTNSDLDKAHNGGFLLKVAGYDAKSGGEETEKAISYTVKGKGAVQVVDQHDGTYRIIPTRAGNVTVTFKTPSGKSGKCTFTVKAQ